MSITDEIVLMRTGAVQQQCPPQQMAAGPRQPLVAGLGIPPSISFGWTCGGTGASLVEDAHARGCAARRMGRSWWASGLEGAQFRGRGFGLRLRLWRCGKDLLVTFTGERPAPFWTSPPVWRQATPWSRTRSLAWSISLTRRPAHGWMRRWRDEGISKPPRAENPLGNTRRSAKAYLYLLLPCGFGGLCGSPHPHDASDGVLPELRVPYRHRHGIRPQFVPVRASGSRFRAGRAQHHVYCSGGRTYHDCALPGGSPAHQFPASTKGLFQTLYFLPMSPPPWPSAWCSAGSSTRNTATSTFSGVFSWSHRSGCPIPT